MEDNPNLTDDFFGMLTRYIKYQPDILIKCSSVNDILKLAEIGLPITHIRASIMIILFITRFLNTVYQEPEPNCIKETL